MLVGWIIDDVVDGEPVRGRGLVADETTGGRQAYFRAPDENALRRFQ